MEIAGSSALITGGASGLGAATARRLVGQGACMVIADLNREAGLALEQELGARFVETDVTDDSSMRQAINAAIAAYGELHILVCCAGVATPDKVLGKDGPLDLQRFARVVQINLVGTFNAIRLAAEQMAKNPPNSEGERGVIITTASVAAFDGQIGQAAYSASK